MPPICGRLSLQRRETVMQALTFWLWLRLLALQAKGFANVGWSPLRGGRL